MKKLACALAIACLGLGAAFAASQTQKSESSSGSTQTQKGKRGLAGSRWDVTLTPDEASAAKGTTPFTDVLIFDNANKMTSPECMKYGFDAAPFKASHKGEVQDFSSTLKSAAEGSSEWTGTVEGDAINGTMVWKKKDGSTVTYKLSGKRQN